jgi:hypothetical protein
MAAINIELLDALKKAGVDEQKRGSVLALMHRFSCQEQRARGHEDADEGLRLGRRPDECQTSA